jgi:hypothetical protein
MQRRVKLIRCLKFQTKIWHEIFTGAELQFFEKMLPAVASQSGCRRSLDFFVQRDRKCERGVPLEVIIKIKTKIACLAAMKDRLLGCFCISCMIVSDIESLEGRTRIFEKKSFDCGASGLLCGLFWMWICSSDVGFSDGEPD